MELIFEECKVPRGNLIGKEGDGFLMLLRGLNGGRISIGAMAVGITRAAYETALGYVKTRVQSRHQNSNFQGIHWVLADMAIRIEASRWLNYRAAFLADRNQPFVKEASMSKCFATDTAMWVTNEAVQILSKDGVTKEFPVERYMREAKILQIVEGTNEVQRNAIVKELLGH
jgi:butyryl-CoA dehydrogenase